MAKFGKMTPRTKKTQKSKFLLTKSTLRLVVSNDFAFTLTKMLLKGFAIAAKPLNQQILVFFSILLVSRLRLTCSVCDGTLETSYWKYRQWVLRVCKLVNIQKFIYNGHFGAKNHCCAVNHPRPKKHEIRSFSSPSPHLN